MATSTPAADAAREAVRRRLETDYAYYPERALKIRTKTGQVIPFVLKRPQLRLARALMRQRDAGQPQRAVILKARQIGMSTAAQGLLIQRATQQPNHIAWVVAQDRLTASALFNIGRFMWSQLPEQIRPELAFERNSLDQKLMHFGIPSQQLRRSGMLGLESQIQISTAKVTSAGRGLTLRSLHLSETAWWERTDKLLGLMQAVPDDPDSLALNESTPNGHNHFKDEWDRAEGGEGGWLAFFSPWFEEDTYRRPFASAEEQWEFEQKLGRGKKGEEEPKLQEYMVDKLRAWADEDRIHGDFFIDVSEGAIEQRVLEHLHWRRWAIDAKTEGSIEKFHQEYPSTPEEAFLSTGRRVFNPTDVRDIIARCEKTDPPVPTEENPGPVSGALAPAEEKMVRARRHTTIMVPARALWVPGREAKARDLHAGWRLWQAPDRGVPASGDGRGRPPGQYIVACDPASGKEDDRGVTHAEHGVQIIDHRTLKQVAEYRSQIDPDELADQLLLAALHFNRAWIVVESTGGYGLSINRILTRDYKYARVFEDESRDKRIEDRTERLGFHTDAVSKPLIEARALQLVREGNDGIRSLVLARQMLSFIRDSRGRTKPESGKLSDLLMAWMIGQYVASIRPIRPEKPSGARRNVPPRHRR